MAPSRKSRDLEELIGQLLIIGFAGTEMSAPLRSLISRVLPGGVILFARNITAADQTSKLLKACQSLVATPMFLCVDMEGGRVDRFRNAIAPAPAPADVFATRNRKIFRQHGKIIGDCCRALGFNTDFAPTLDLAFEASRSVMSSRAVSANPKEVALFASEFLKGLRDAGVLGSGKHFPGLGEGKLDSHDELPIIEKPWKKLWEQDLLPYRSLRRDLPFVMVGHATYPAVTRDRMPASLSPKWVSEILRKKIGYRGIIVSDDLEMGGVQAAMATPEAAVAHIRAGGDMALLCHQRDFVTSAHELLVKEAERDRKFAKRVAESAVRILAWKKKFPELRRASPVPTTERLERLSRQLWEFGESVRLAAIARQVRA
ncbi:MAG TPA: beta-N-acetylhexosaminidase [Terriglobales bacterium]|nr:beta-N-acetylhexosaminidase [Terriglobales bacterium]